MNGYKAILTLLLLLLMLPRGVPGQDPVAIRYTVEDGLPSNEVYDAYEDEFGNIWFATDHGVSRFDGYTFTLYTTHDGLSDNTVFEFKEDHRGVVWMRCFNGTLSYMVNGVIHPYPHNQKLLAQLKNSFMADFELDDKGKVYFTLFRHYPMHTKVLDLATGEVEDLDGVIGEMAGLLNYGDPLHRIPLFSALPAGPEAFTPFTPVSCSGQGKSWSIKGMYSDQTKNGRTISFSLDHDTDVGIFGEFLYRIEGCRIAYMRQSPPSFASIEKDHQNRIWVLGGTGATILTDDLSTARQFFRKDYCLGMFQSRKGDYWICTMNGVLQVHNLDNQVFTEIEGSPLVMTRKLHVIDSTLFVLNNHNTIRSAKVTSRGLEWDQVNYPIAPIKFLQDFVPIRVNGKYEVFFSGGQLARSKIIPFDPEEVSTSAVWQVRQQEKGFLMTGPRGFQALDFDGGRKELVMTYRQMGVPSTSIVEDDGTIWIGTTNGVYLYKHDTLMPFGPENKLMRERVTDLALLPNGTVVVSTRGSGLLVILKDRIFQFDQRQGIASNMCNRLHLGKSGLWVCSNRGLSLITLNHSPDGEPLVVYNYTVLDGLPSNKVNDVLEFGGYVFVATENGLLVLQGNIKGGNLPETRIEQVKVDDRIIHAGDELTTDEDNLQIRFQSQKLTEHGNVAYNYILEGYDRGWHSTTDNIVNYYNLPPGTYTFKVSAGYPYARRNLNQDQMLLVLPYKLYERRGFQLVLLLTVLLGCFFAGWVAYNGRQRRLRSDYTRLQSEVKALRSQMRPHFIFNALNSIQQLILLRDHETAHVHLARFARLMRAVLEASNHESIPIAKEIEILQMYLELEKLRFGDDFAYSIDLQQGVDWETLRIPPMLLQPLVENAIWHGLRMKKEDPSLWLRFSLTPEGTICCEVKDNGIGRKAAGLKTQVHKDPSVSLANILDRIRLINTLSPDSIELEITDLEQDGVATGTLVKLYLSHFPHDTPND